MSKQRIQTVDDFLDAIGGLPVAADPAHIAADLQALQLAFPDPEAFMAALRSVLAELGHAVKHADTWGVEMKGHYRGWRRAAFPSQRVRGSRADLRLVFRPLSDGRVEVRVFGHRRLPEEVYVRGKDRLNGA